MSGLTSSSLTATSTGALASASIYTILLFAILACNRDQVQKAFGLLTQGGPARPTKKTVFIALVGMALLFAVDQALVILPGLLRSYGKPAGGAAARCCVVESRLT